MFEGGEGSSEKPLMTVHVEKDLLFKELKESRTRVHPHLDPQKSAAVKRSAAQLEISAV